MRVKGMVKFLLTLSIVWLFSGNIFAQRKITIVASDKLIVTADLYLSDNGAPYIILFHQENSSRGEFREIAPKLQKMGFNCLAIDLRHGKESNYVQNETVIKVREEHLPATTLDCEKDILAAIDYISKTAIKNKCVLFGSSFSASLAMKAANHNKYVTAVIAFSPGEYFTPSAKVEHWLADFDKPLFVASTKREYPFIASMLKDIPQQDVILFQPSVGDGVHGAPALWSSNPSSNEYWMALMMFMKKVKETKYQ